MRIRFNAGLTILLLSKQELQGKLHQPRICPHGCRCDDPEIWIVGYAANRVWLGELRSVEDVQKLRAELQA